MKQGWKIKKLGEVYDVRDGTHDSPKYVKEGYALITSKNLKNDTLNYDKVNYITEQDYININKRSKVDVGDILFAMIGTIGNPIVIKNEPDFAIKNVALFKVTENQDSCFLKYYLDSGSVIDKMSKDAKGATQKFVGLGYLRNFPIPLPPLPEQKRIVAILDKAFAAIAKAQANAEQNLKNAKELFESYLQVVFENKGEGWEEKTLGEIADVEYGYTDKSTGEGDYRYIRITDIDKNGELILEGKKFLKHSKEAKKFLAEENDLLMARTGATFAKVLLYKDYEPSVFASYLIRIKFKEKIKNELYWFFTKTNYYWKQANSLSSGAAQPHFNGAAVKQVVFSYPKSIKEQQVLIKRFKSLSAETKKLEAIYQQKLDNLEELKKSALQKAFNGEL